MDVATHHLVIALLTLLLSFGWGDVAVANPSMEKRVALVIGNSTYKTVPALPNTENDAGDVAAALRANGFEVIEGRNLDRRGMGEVLGRFARAADGVDAALFYYAGHGLQFRGENYLVSTDSAPTDEFGIPYETTRVADVVEALSNAKGTRILMLDACRNNPLADRIARAGRTRDVGASRGLARISQTQGMVVAYATQANDVAADGLGRNSPFTAAFLEQLREPGLEVGQLFRRVAVDVNKRTGGRQTPELSLSLLGEFYFNRNESDQQAWSKLRDSDDAAELRSFLGRFPNSFLSDAAKARIDLLDRVQREETLRRELARYGDERRNAEEAAEVARKAEISRLAAEKAERERLLAAQSQALRSAEEDAARQLAEQKRRLDERLAQFEADNRRFQRELASRAAEEERRARDDKERQRQSAERDRLSAAQAEQLRASEMEANRQKQEAERRITERLVKLEEENRRASAELAARFRSEQEMRETADRERAKLLADLEQEKRRASEELLRVQREATAGTATPSLAPSSVPVQVAALPHEVDIPSPVATPDLVGLTRTINLELTRIGCYSGTPDAAWSARPTSKAVRDAARLTRVAVPDQPNIEFLEMLRRQRGRLCPLVCSPRQIDRNGTCVVKSCPAGETLDARGTCIASKKRVAQPRDARPKPIANAQKPQGPVRGGRCFTFNGQSFCE